MNVWVASTLYKLQDPEQTGFVKSIALDNKGNLYFSCENSPMYKIQTHKYNEKAIQMGNGTDIARGIVFFEKWNLLMYCNRAQCKIQRIDLNTGEATELNRVVESADSVERDEYIHLSHIFDFYDAVCVHAPITGHKDGWADEAVFGEQSDIVFLSGNDTLYVADPPNYCIRQIEENGRVATLTGNANEEGFQDGTLEQARFTYPHGITRDSNENLYVTDLNTLRKIDLTKSIVETIKIAGIGSSLLTCVRFDETFQNVYISGDTGIYQIVLSDQPRLVSWLKGERYLWIGHLKESDCILAAVPKEIIKQIAYWLRLY